MKAASRISSASISAKSKIGKTVAAGFQPIEGSPAYGYNNIRHIEIQELDQNQSTLVDT